ncbi:ROK family protein [Ferdinandcohnia quinoae]|uniref:ROK family protein n=1 Tax=Fredinandcohnia quinoae TaxID=2918902 RepID=A0AAW5DUK5_9BACI|nr:ROK family protein [Fredinandcohnia sp. SECRCQ15]MCH1624315.1 ROK family protein [Fredinandcohnia sp. SECRCQ15]
MSMRVGIDLGGTNVRVALINKEGAILDLLQAATEASKGYKHTINKMSEMINQICDGKEIEGIGIGAPGPLDNKTGVILSPPNLPDWDHVPIVKILKERFGTTVILNNDASVAALAEANVGSGVGYDSVYYLTVSTGIGGGFVINKQLFNGAQGYAAEIGNMILDPNGYKHNNLNKGSFEGLASGTSIARRATEQYGIKGGAKEVFRLAAEGQTQAKHIIDDTVDYLAMGIANIAHIVNPAIFVMGGGVMESKEFILSPLREKVKEYLYPALAETIKIAPASLGGNAGVIGAAMLV